MNSAHDVGGMHGFGPVVPEENEPVFHEEWERKAFVTHMATVFQGVVGPLDAVRHSGERMGNRQYLSTSYYEQWLLKTEKLLVETGTVSADELTERGDLVRQDPARFALPAADGPDELSRLVGTIIEHGGSPLREIDAVPSFLVGDEVVTTRRSPKGHTRIPRYARGRRGRIVLHHGAHVFPDANAHGLGECPEHLYTVRFEATELWGEDADGAGAVHVDLWESYLSPAGKEGN